MRLNPATSHTEKVYNYIISLHKHFWFRLKSTLFSGRYLYSTNIAMLYELGTLPGVSKEERVSNARILENKTAMIVALRSFLCC